MKDLNYLFNKLLSSNRLNIYYDLNITTDYIDNENIKYVISESKTLIDRVLLLTSLIDDVDSDILKLVKEDNIDIFKLIKYLSKIETKCLNKIEESQDGWFYTFEDSKYENELVILFENAKKSFK